MIRLGSHQIPTILGLDPWGSQMRVWARLHGLVGSTEGNAATKRGHRLERHIIGWWAEDAGNVVCTPGPPYGSEPIVSSDYQWLGVHPDAWVWFLDGRPPERRPDAEAEGKTRRYLAETLDVRGKTWPGWGASGTDQVPLDVAAQVVAQLAACELDQGFVVAYGTAFDDDRWYRLPRNERVLRGMMAQALAWYEKHVVEGEPPIPDGSEDTTTVLNAAIREGAGREARVATPDEVAAIELAMRKRATLADLKHEIDRVVQTVKLAMGPCSVLLDPRTEKPLVTWRAPKRAGDGPAARRFLFKGEVREDE